MKTRGFKTFLAIMVCLSLLPMTSALALKASGDGALHRGLFEDSGITFQAPASFTLDGIDARKNVDIIKLVGPKDVNSFIPRITVKISVSKFDLKDIPLSEVEHYITLDLDGTNFLNLVDETITEGDKEALRRVSFYNTKDERMGMLYQYMFNVGEYGVTVEYRAYTATRSLPDDISALPELVKTFAIE